MSDDYDDADFEEEDFQESPELNSLSRYAEVVFCPDCDLYMPYKVDGAIVRRQCPSCKKLFEGGSEVSLGALQTTSPKKRAIKTAESSGDSTPCAATTKAGNPCQNPPRGGSKYCSSHKGWRPPRA